MTTARLDPQGRSIIGEVEAYFTDPSIYEEMKKGFPMSEVESGQKAKTITSLDEFVAELKSANAAYGSEVAVLTNTFAERIVDILERVDDTNISPLTLQLVMVAEGLELKHKLEQSLANIGASMEHRLS